MKNTGKASIKDYIDLDESLFHSKIYFPNEVIIGEDFRNAQRQSFIDMVASPLYMNARTNKDGNLYEQFIEKYYRKPLSGLFGKQYGEEITIELYPYLSIMDGDDRRYFGISNDANISALILKSFPQTLESVFRSTKESFENGEPLTKSQEELMDDENAYELLKKCLKADRALIKSVLDGTAPREVASMFHFIKPDGSEVPAIERKGLLEKLIEKYTQKIMTVRYLNSIFGKEIDSNEFLKCFDYDKLCLIMAYSSCIDIKLKEERGEALPGSFQFLSEYAHAVRNLRKKSPSYNESIKITKKDEKGIEKTIKFTTDDALAIYVEKEKALPEINENPITVEELFKRFGIKQEDVKELSPKEYTALIMDLLEKIKKIESVTFNWEFLAPKEGEVERETGAYSGEAQSKLLDSQIAIRSNAFNAYIASLPTLAKLRGINSFDGYTAYVFSNGRVILEKPKSLKKGEYYSATYIMPIDSFFTLSTLSRTEIINGLTDGSIKDVKRIYHTYKEGSEDPISSYKKKIETELEGSEYSPEMIEAIYTIIEEEKQKAFGNGNQRVRTSENK